MSQEKRQLRGDELVRANDYTDPKPDVGGHSFFDIDWDKVKAMCVIHCTVGEIASVLEISSRTLTDASKRQYNMCFSELHKIWSAGGKCSLRRKQWKLADKNTTMAIFLGKQMLGQRDDISLNHHGEMVQNIVHYGDKPPKKWEQEQQMQGNDEKKEHSS